MDSMRKNAQKMMPHVMALNKKPTMGMKNDRQPAPAVSKLVAFAKGGKVMANGGAADMKQDKAMLSRHNRLMHPGQKSKLMNGGLVSKYAEGGSVKKEIKKPTKPEPLKDLTPEDKKKAKMGINPYPGRSEDMEYAKGGPAKKGMGIMIGIKFGKPKAHAKGGKAKGDKKKVMGTVGEAKAMMAALQKARRPATPMPGTPMAGLGMAPPMAPPMKHGGKVMKKANGGMSRPLQDQRMQMAPRMAPPMAGMGSPMMKKGGKVMKKAAGGAAKLRKKSPMPDKIKMVNYSRGG
jgi:hypothetical protein